MTELTRRQFLAAGLIATGAAALSPALIGCSPSESTTASPPFDELRGLLRGKVILPSDSGYERGSLPWNARFDSVRPLAVLKVADTNDVAHVVNFVRDHNVAFAVRGGAHNYAGYSTSDGVLIDLSALNTVALAASGDEAQIGGATPNLAMYQQLFRRGKTVPGGSCPTVAVGGLTLGGGAARLSRRDGLTCDRVISLEIVTADGKVRQVDAASDPDLFWACRGGGGGNFGIVTGFNYRTTPADMPFTIGNITFPMSSAGRVGPTWEQWVATLPNQGFSYITLINGKPADGATIVINFSFAGSAGKANESVREFLGEVGIKPQANTVKTGGFYDGILGAACAALSAEECGYQQLSDAGTNERPAIYVKSNFAESAWPSAAYEVMANALQARQTDPAMTPPEFKAGVNAGRISFESLGGAIKNVSPTASAFVHRNANLLGQFQARWSASAPADTAAKNMAWLNETYSALGPYLSNTAYVNYPDPLLQDWQDQYYGENLPKLKSVKSTYDPGNVFSFAQSIPLA